MMLFKYLAIAGTIGSAAAQTRPSNTSICDFYTTALLTNNTGANQKTLLTLLVNTVVIGNYTKPNVGVSVAGILAPGTYQGIEVDLAPYFDGGFASTNRGGNSGVSVNFLDGGGATPLLNDMPSNDTTSNQFLLLTHLYEFFGVLLGCSLEGGVSFSAYDGEASMYEVHKFMDLSAAEVGYFITQVADAAASFGVAKDDLTIVGNALTTLFGTRCSAPATVVKKQGPALQAICIDSTCPLAPNATCSSYENATEPSIAVASLVPNSTSTSPTSSPTAGGAARYGLSMGAVAVGLAALML